MIFDWMYGKSVSDAEFGWNIISIQTEQQSATVCLQQKWTNIFKITYFCYSSSPSAFFPFPSFNLFKQKLSKWAFFHLWCWEYSEKVAKRSFHFRLFYPFPTRYREEILASDIKSIIITFPFIQVCKKIIFLQLLTLSFWHICRTRIS